MFETFNTPAMYVAIQAVLSLYASGRTTGGNSTSMLLNKAVVSRTSLSGTTPTQVPVQYIQFIQVH